MKDRSRRKITGSGSGGGEISIGDINPEKDLAIPKRKEDDEEKKRKNKGSHK